MLTLDARDQMDKKKVSPQEQAKLDLYWAFLRDKEHKNERVFTRLAQLGDYDHGQKRTACEIVLDAFKPNVYKKRPV